MCIEPEPMQRKAMKSTALAEPKDPTSPELSRRRTQTKVLQLRSEIERMERQHAIDQLDSDEKDTVHALPYRSGNVRTEVAGGGREKEKKQIKFSVDPPTSSPENYKPPNNQQDRSSLHSILTNSPNLIKSASFDDKPFSSPATVKAYHATTFLPATTKYEPVDSSRFYFTEHDFSTGPPSNGTSSSPADRLLYDVSVLVRGLCADATDANPDALQKATEAIVEEHIGRSSCLADTLEFLCKSLSERFSVRKTAAAVTNYLAPLIALHGTLKASFDHRRRFPMSRDANFSRFFQHFKAAADLYYELIFEGSLSDCEGKLLDFAVSLTASCAGLISSIRHTNNKESKEQAWAYRLSDHILLDSVHSPAIEERSARSSAFEIDGTAVVIKKSLLSKQWQAVMTLPHGPLTVVERVPARVYSPELQAKSIVRLLICAAKLRSRYLRAESIIPLVWNRSDLHTFEDPHAQAIIEAHLERHPCLQIVASLLGEKQTWLQVPAIDNLQKC